jgi:archaemetzincin
MSTEPASAPIEGVDFVPVGALPAATAGELVARVSRHLAVPCRLRRPDPELYPTLLTGRTQYDAHTLLRDLEARRDAPERILVAVTELDLALLVFTHVFGLARPGGGAAVVSLARLRPELYGLPADAALTLRRATAEILHELGHAAGLDHCQDFTCLMHFAPDVESIDLRGQTFCPHCAATLPPGLLAGSAVGEGVSGPG